jgi:nucleoid-associated protein YgaU
VLFPIAPEKIVTQTEVKNKTVSLIDGSEIVLTGGKSLRKFSFELLLPNSEYPFAVYENEFYPASYYIEKLEDIAQKNEPVWLDIYRTLPDMEKTYLTNVLTVPEKITIEENASDGLDMRAEIVLTEYRSRGTSTLKSGESYSSSREDNLEVPYEYTVKSGDSLWLIAKKYLGSGEKYVYLAKINSMKSPYKITAGQVIKLRE